MNYTVSVVRGFSSAHALREYRGRCERLHGHNWKVKVSLTGKKLNRIGMVMDFTEMRAALDRILERLDHHYLNETAPFDTINPTAENIAAYIFTGMKKQVIKGITVSSVEVWESEGSSAIVTA